MLKTLITNNCWGGVIAHNYGMEFCSPTVNLQILPEDFPKFCENLSQYLEMDLKECDNLTKWHETCLINMFGYVPDFRFPLGMVGDVLVVFQHYDTFEDAKEKWDIRRKRVDFNNIGYMFHLKDPKYTYHAKKVMALNLPNSVCITEDFSLDGAYRFDVPEGMDAFGGIRGEDGNMRRIIEQNFKIKDWMEGKL